MNNTDKNKLKVLVKMILIQRSPRFLTAKQIVNIISEYEWGFKTEISPSKVAKLMFEMNKNGGFMKNIELKRRRNDTIVYGFPDIYKR